MLPVNLNYSAILCPSECKRKLSAFYVLEAIEVLRSYRSYNQISQEEYNSLAKEIKSAPHDDAIANIMTHLRKRVYA